LQKDSIFANAISICHRSGLVIWEIRLLNRLSQLKTGTNEIERAMQLSTRAIWLAENDKNIINSVDYRDVIVQMTQVQFYKNNFDSCVYWCRKGQRLARKEKDFFNESILTSQEAVGLILKDGDSFLIDSLFKYAYQLALRTTTRHDDVMALLNHAAFLKSDTVHNIKASMEALLSVQDFSTDPELQKNTVIPYRRVPFFYRGTHLMMLVELANGYKYLGDNVQAISYLEEFSGYVRDKKDFTTFVYGLFTQAFYETSTNPVKRIQRLFDSATQSAKKYIGKSEIPSSDCYYVKAWLAEQRSEWKLAEESYKLANLYSMPGAIESKFGIFRVFVKSRNIKKADSLYLVIKESLSSGSNQYYRLLFYKELSAYYLLNNKKMEALESQIQYHQLKDSMTDIANYIITSRFEKQFKTKEKDRLLSLAEKEKMVNQKQLALRNRQTLILSGGILLLALTTLLSVRNYQLKKKQTAILQQKNNHIETLIRELHHRVKNNLQVVSGLLSLQSNRMEDDTARQAMDEGRNRVDAMAMIHQKLYMDQNLAGVDIKDYLENLTMSLAGSFGYESKHIETYVDLPKPSMDIDRAIPIGLIVNELVTNAFKHAFNSTPNPKINVSLAHNTDGFMELKVSDNGAGITTVSSSSKSFGMKLVNTLIVQLNGTMQQEFNNGTNYTIKIST
jgi:two-component sensor histidine kinase